MQVGNESSSSALIACEKLTLLSTFFFPLSLFFLFLLPQSRAYYTPFSLPLSRYSLPIHNTSMEIKEQRPHVRWAPLRGIPLERRLQMLAVCTWVFLLFICLVLFAYCFTLPFLWPLLIAYITFLYTDKAPETGGRRFDWTRRWPLWKYFVDYFPAKLVKVQTQNRMMGHSTHDDDALRCWNRNMIWIPLAITCLVIILMASSQWAPLPTLQPKLQAFQTYFPVSSLPC